MEYNNLSNFKKEIISELNKESEISQLENIVLIAGNSNNKLALNISNYLKKDLCKINISQFSNTEIKINICENIRNKDIFIIQTGNYISDSDNNIKYSINDVLIETLIMIDACKRSMVKTINLIMPCYPYARQDKKEESREPITAKLVANLLTVAGITRLIVMDLHASQIQGFFDIPVDNIYSINLVIDHLNKYIFDNLCIVQRQQNYIVVSPDAGATKRTLKFAKLMKLDTVIMHKQRNYEKINSVEKTILIGEEEQLINKTAIICDDICDTGGTLLKVIDNLKKYKIKDVIVIITHAIFSGKCIENMNNSDLISRIIVSDSISQDNSLRNCDKVSIFSIGDLMGDVIINITNGGSLSKLFL